MKRTLQFRLPNDGIFQILTRQELIIIGSSELDAPEMPEILFIKNARLIKNKALPTKRELRAKLEIILADIKN